MGVLPDFNENGLLPARDYELTFDELKDSILVYGSRLSRTEHWDSEWRLKLINNCEELVNQLRQIGIEEIFLDGSFVEQKDHPNDIDGYFECDFTQFVSGHIQRELNKIDPHKVWTWNRKERKAYKGYVKKQLPMWHIYRVELYPHYGNFSGITDNYGNPMTFPAAFRCKRSNGMPKGIIKIVSD
jgi:hypothetical protein